MALFITQNPFKLIKKLALLIFLLPGLGVYAKEHQKKTVPDPFKKLRHVQLALPSGKLIQVKLAITNEEQVQGLSGTKESSFSNNQGLLFFYLSTGPRQFWMPNTFFNLHIIFLDKNLKVIAIEKNVPAHPGLKKTPFIYKTKPYFARHVLEIKASSPLGREINKGTQFLWISKTSLLETESQIRQQL